jgi:hypothetical protein
VWRGFIFDLSACKCQCIKCPCRRSRCGGGEPTRPSSEAEPHPSERPALERGGTLPEGGDRPSSEEEPHPRERQALERGGTPLEGAPSPRARRKFAHVVPRPLSGAEFCSRVAGPLAWWAVGATRAVGPAVGQ